ISRVIPDCLFIFWTIPPASLLLCGRKKPRRNKGLGQTVRISLWPSGITPVTALLSPECSTDKKVNLCRFPWNHPLFYRTILTVCAKSVIGKKQQSRKHLTSC